MNVPGQNVFHSNPNLKQSIFVSRVERRQLSSLANLFSEGLRQGSVCIAILTPRHRRALNRRLRAKGIDVRRAAKAEQYITLNARGILPLIDFDGDFDETTYYNAVKKIASWATWENQRVRAFGEIVGRTWPRLSSKLGLVVPQNE